MKINNPFIINDWKFGDFSKLVLLIQVLVLVITSLQFYNIQLPILGPIITFIYLSFIPGFLILRILRIHGLGNIKTIIYCVGLSLLSVMFIGFIMNSLYGFMGILRPISLFYLILTFTVYVLFLLILSYFMDGKYKKSEYICLNDLLNSKLLFLCIFPFLAFFGSYFINYYGNNIISMFLILLIGFTIILVSFDIIPKKFYPFTIWIISISLLYMSSLISTYIWGWDIQNEYFLAKLVLNNAYWNNQLFDAYNSMLSVVMLGPIYSIITTMNLDEVYKIIVPFLFSLVPLGIYSLIKDQTKNSKISFLAVFLFISFNTFYIEMLSLTREMIAEIFLVALLFLVFNRKFKANFLILFLLMGLGLIVSHYSTNYVFIFFFISVILIITIFNLFTKEITLNKDLIILLISVTTLVFFMIIFTILWYDSFSQGTAILSIWDVFNMFMRHSAQKIGIAQELIYGIIFIPIMIVIALLTVYLIKFRDFKPGLRIYNLIFNIQTLIRKKFRYTHLAVLSILILFIMFFLTGPPKTWIVTVIRYLNFDIVFFTLTGLFTAIIYFNKNKFQKEFLVFSILAASMLIAGIMIPTFETSFNITRIYEITFIFLAVFCVIGALKVIGFIYYALKKKKIEFDKSIKIFSIFLTIFLFFNAGFVSVLFNQSVPLHLNGKGISSDYHPLFDQQEVTGAMWLSENRVSTKIFADIYGVFVFFRYIAVPNEIATNNGVSVISNYDNSTSYIFLRKLNRDYVLLIHFGTKRDRVYENMSGEISPKNEIYDNGNSWIYYG